jgi:putative two-component system response regulator
VVAVADVYDALTSVRPYKRAWGVDAAYEFLRSQRDRHFDARLVDAFAGARTEVLSVQEELRDQQQAGAAK